MNKNTKNDNNMHTSSRHSAPAKDARLKWIEKMSTLLDDQFSVGKYKFGIDPLLNFIPYVGDVVTYLMSALLVLTILRHGVSGKVAVKMIGNITLDAVLGAIPVLGWIFDFNFKANRRNVNLLKAHYIQGKHKGSAKPYIIMLLVMLLIVMLLIFWLTYQILKWLLQAIQLPVT